jgi:arylsulfatase A-like enzyme
LTAGAPGAYQRRCDAHRSDGRRGAGTKYTEYQTDEPELYNETTDPFELTNVVTDPANAATVATLAARLRVLRPGWPASPSGAFIEP